MKKYEELNATLAYSFNKSMIDDPSTAEALPDDAVVIMQIEGYEAFNRWAKKISLAHPLGNDQKVVYAVFRFDPELSPRQTTPKRLVQAHVEDLELLPA